MAKTSKEPEKNKCAKCGTPTFHDLCVRCRTKMRYRYFSAEQDPYRTGTRTGVLDLSWDVRQRARRRQIGSV